MEDATEMGEMMTISYPTDAEIAEIASQKAFSDHDQLRRVLNVVEGTPEDATDPVVLIDRNKRDRLIAAARDRNRLEGENAKLREALKTAAYLLNGWVKAIQDNGTSWDDWDYWYKQAAYDGNLDAINAALITTQAARIETLEAEKYLIWSNEHDAWWRSNRCGYTTILAIAGRYTREEAISICAHARDGFAVVGAPSEIMVREADVGEIRARATLEGK